MEYALVGNIEYKHWSRNLSITSTVFSVKENTHLKKKNGFGAVAFLFVCCYKHQITEEISQGIPHALKKATEEIPN